LFVNELHYQSYLTKIVKVACINHQIPHGELFLRGLKTTRSLTK
jgi:hypothetical protein